MQLAADGNSGHSRGSGFPGNLRTDRSRAHVSNTDKTNSFVRCQLEEVRKKEEKENRRLSEALTPCERGGSAQETQMTGPHR